MLWTSNTSGRSNVTDWCGLLRWIDAPISCPKCERLVPSLLSTSWKNAKLKLLKAKEVAEKGVEFQRIKFLLCFSWLFFVLFVLVW
ncbi:hypothetical protein Hanom_Chr00s001245g01677851 [Helianthus anomalus]